MAIRLTYSEGNVLQDCVGGGEGVKDIDKSQNFCKVETTAELT